MSHEVGVIDPLPREEVAKAIERKGSVRVPLVRAKWWGEGLRERYGDELRRFDRWPEDAPLFTVEPVPLRRMGLSWKPASGGGHDSNAALDEWSKLDELIDKMPSPDSDPEMEKAARAAREAKARGVYVCFGWWRLFFERPWLIRGMTNLMLDYYEEPENVLRLHEALLRQYERYIDWFAREVGPDGFWTSDDLGNQRALMMSPATFAGIIEPYYVRLGETVRRHGLHWWLHSCGNNTEVMDSLARAGVNVFHPVQKGTMDEVETARRFGDRMSFLAGFDVQHVLPEGSPEDVRREVRFLVDTFDGPGGGMCIAAGNGIVPPVALENIEAFLDEAVTYGAAHRAGFA